MELSTITSSSSNLRLFIISCKYIRTMYISMAYDVRSPQGMFV